MLQRVQTLFLLVVLLVAISLIFLPFINIVGYDGDHMLCLMPGCDNKAANSMVYLPMIVNAVIILLSAITIFQYKNRIRQAKLANILGILNILLTGLFFIVFFNMPFYVKKDFGTILENVEFKVGSFLPILSAIAAFMAARYIQKDEKLVRSADRIR